MHTFRYVSSRPAPAQWEVFIIVWTTQPAQGNQPPVALPSENVVGYFNSAVRAAVAAAWLNGGAQPAPNSGFTTDPKTGLIKDA